MPVWFLIGKDLTFLWQNGELNHPNKTERLDQSDDYLFRYLWYPFMCLPVIYLYKLMLFRCLLIFLLINVC